VISLLGRLLEHSGKHLDLARMHDQHRAALALAPDAGSVRPEPIEIPGALEWFGDRVLEVGAGIRAFGELAAETVRQLGRVASHRVRMPAGALRHHVEVMGFDAIFIVALLSFLTGMTMGFQGAVQLQRFGAGVFVADMIGNVDGARAWCR